MGTVALPVPWALLLGAPVLALAHTLLVIRVEDRARFPRLEAALFLLLAGCALGGALAVWGWVSPKGGGGWAALATGAYLLGLTVLWMAPASSTLARRDREAREAQREASGRRFSAWHWQALELPNADGSLVARMDDMEEVCMGGPTRGTLRISNGIVVRGLSPSMVWSEDGRYLAVCTGARGGSGVCLIDARAFRLYELPYAFGVVELDAFRDGVIEGRLDPNTVDIVFRIPLDRLLKSPATRLVPRAYRPTPRTP